MIAHYMLHNTEESFVIAYVFEFVKTWTSGQKSSLLLECDNGEAWLKLGFRLGHPNAPHVHNYDTTPSSPQQRSRKYPRKAKRDRKRAVEHANSKSKSSDESQVKYEPSV